MISRNSCRRPKSILGTLPSRSPEMRWSQVTAEVDGSTKHGKSSTASSAEWQDGVDRPITMISTIRPCRFPSGSIHFSSSPPRLSPPCLPICLPLSGFGIISFLLAGSPIPRLSPPYLGMPLCPDFFWNPASFVQAPDLTTSSPHHPSCGPETLFSLKGLFLKIGGLASHFDTLKLSVFLSPANGHVN